MILFLFCSFCDFVPHAMSETKVEMKQKKTLPMKCTNAHFPINPRSDELERQRQNRDDNKFSSRHQKAEKRRKTKNAYALPLKPISTRQSAFFARKNKNERKA